MRKGSITQANLARRLGVSQTLVSRVLSGKGRSIGAAPETIRRILRVASAAGYKPSLAARALRGGPTGSFGVCVRDFNDPFFGHLLGEMQALARKEGYTLLITGGEPGDMATLHQHSPDGLILLGSDFEPEDFDLFLYDRAPMARIGHGKRSDRMVEVSMDEAAGLNSLLEHLVALGHRQIEFVGTRAPYSERRAEILKKILAARATDVQVAFRLFPMRPGEAGRCGVLNLADRGEPDRPTALMTSDDSVAYGALRTLADLKWPVPGDISVAGVDDLPFSSGSIPSLTTLRTPFRPMVRSAFEVLTGKRMARSGTIRIRAKLICRESTGPVAGRRPEFKTKGD